MPEQRYERSPYEGEVKEVDGEVVPDTPEPLAWAYRPKELEAEHSTGATVQVHMDKPSVRPDEEAQQSAEVGIAAIRETQSDGPPEEPWKDRLKSSYGPPTTKEPQPDDPEAPFLEPPQADTGS